MSMTDAALAHHVRLAVAAYNAALDDARRAGLKVKGSLDLILYPALRTECLRQIDAEEDVVLCPEAGCGRALGNT